ncbi:MAG: HepT-like ribonuclease domain-containing protein [Ktedonobacterales bacterium]
MTGSDKNDNVDVRADLETSKPGGSSAGGGARDARVILDEMLESMRLIHNYTQGFTYETFASEQLLQDAVVLRIVILGEAANHLSAEDKARWSDVPWRILADTRNRLIHGYFAMRLDLVWQVITVDLPILESQLRTLRDSLA